MGLMFGLTALGMGAVWVAQKLPGFFGFTLATAAAALGLWVALSLWRRNYRSEIDLLSLKGWRVALLVFAAGALMLLLLNTPSLRAFSVSGAAFHLVWFVAFTGVLEELWWRGIWFRVWRGRPFMCIVFGAVLFGAMHLVQNSLGRVLVVIGIGLVFGAARYRGASIGALALVHGIGFNWLNKVILSWNERALPLFSWNMDKPLQFLIYALIAWAMYRFIPAKPAEPALPAGTPAVLFR